MAHKAVSVADYELIPQPHGGAIRPPWIPSTGATAARSSIRAPRKESFGLLAEAAPEATMRLIGLMRSTDERVAAVAASAILDRVHGKATNKPAEDDKPERKMDASHLTNAELDEAIGAVNTLKRLGFMRED